MGTIEATPLFDAKSFFDIRFWGSYTAAKHGAAHISPGGSIVFSSGTAGIRPHPGLALAAAVCSAADGLTRALAIELAPKQIRVNLVIPGLVATPLWDGMDAATREGMYEASKKSLLVGHVGQPEEVALSYLYFMKQTYGTGNSVIVDGGGLLH